MYWKVKVKVMGCAESRRAWYCQGEMIVCSRNAWLNPPPEFVERKEMGSRALR